MDENREVRTRQLIEQIERERGFSRLWPRLLAERDPEFMECLHHVTTHVLHRRNSLPRKMKEIILICLDAFTFFEYGFRIHVRCALEAGATEDEILEALETTGILNVHALTSMLPILVEEVQKRKDSEREKTETKNP